MQRHCLRWWPYFLSFLCIALVPQSIFLMLLIDFPVLLSLVRPSSNE